MKRLLLGFCLLILVLSAAGAGFAWWSWQTLQQPFKGYAGDELSIEIAPGSAGRSILEQLERQGVLADARIARAYLVWALDDPSLKAGEYLFRGPLSIPDVLDKLIRGEVVTHDVTIVEGLTLSETARLLSDAGFGDFQAFVAEMRSTDRIRDLDPVAPDLEGYLFPDTYSFARGTAEGEIVSTLVTTFRQRFSDRLETTRPAGEPGLRDVVTLASIVEKEAQLDEERPLIAGVYAHRLRRGIALYADPTVIFALKEAGTWDGNLRRPDLKIDSPYNTYRFPGLPPGPIASPGLGSLLAAADPPNVPYLYFVSRNDGSHVFATTLAEHNRNVETWQREYWRRKWAGQ